MRRLIIALVVLAVSYLLAPISAVAQTGLTLGPNSTGSISFTAGAGSMTFSGVDGTLSGSGALAGITGDYSLSGGPITLTLVTSTSPSIAYFTATGTLSFDFTSGSTTLLKGTLSLVDLLQGGSSGITNVDLIANLSGVSGTLTAPGEPFANGTGIAQLILNLTGLGFLPTTAGGKARLLSSGTVDPTPEPVSMLLFGTGLIAVGVFARRSRRAAKVA